MRYKLIQEYPNSPKVGHIIKECEEPGLKNYYTSVKEDDDCSRIGMLHISEIIRCPNIWQEVIEKDYEILKFILPGDNIVHIQNAKNSLEFMLKNSNTYKIYSIKRLSDGEIFTIGDKIFPNNKIYKFEIKDNILKIWHCDISFSTPIIEGPSGQPGNCSWVEGINNLKKANQVLFTTEDDVDIFKGDEYYYINSSFNNPWEIVNTKADHLDLINKNDLTYKRFSTKEVAEEYILMNKPCLSINDVAKVFRSANNTVKRSKSSGQRLRDIVKKKLNL